MTNMMTYYTCCVGPMYTSTPVGAPGAALIGSRLQPGEHCHCGILMTPRHLVVGVLTVARVNSDLRGAV